MTTYEAQQLIQFPHLQAEHSSLSPTEKMLLGQFIFLAQPRVIVELGVHQALTSIYMCEFLEQNHIAAVVYGFDLPDVIASLRENNATVRQLEAAGRLCLISGRLPESLIAWMKSHPEAIDIAIIDAQHTYWNVKQELNLIWKRLSNTGYVICDDYMPHFSGVSFAIDTFSRRRDVLMLPMQQLQSSDEMRFSALAVFAKRRNRYSFAQRLRFYSEDVRQLPGIRTLWWKVLRPLLRHK